ncbi:MAG: protease HtpX [Bradymonadales bacterium]|nr:MAG: protease HtpX [Bradymonadales bacterium]
MFRRIFLFVLTNILVLTTITLVMSVFGLRPYLSDYGIDYISLAVFCLLWGFGGAFISLGLSRIMAKMAMRVKVIKPNEAHGAESWVLETTHRLARDAGLSHMPEVGIYDSAEVNAFATGPTKKRSLVAVSTGLLRQMSQDEAEGVLAHEVAHIANGDMVTMTLVQGVVNAFVMFFARIIAFALSMYVRAEMRAIVHIVTVIVLQILFSFLGMMVVSFFSRYREYRADQGGADLAGRHKMKAALQRLQSIVQPVAAQRDQDAFSTLKISGSNRGLAALFATHPPLKERIARLS